MRLIEGVGRFVVQPPLRSGGGAVSGVVGWEPTTAAADAGDDLWSGPMGGLNDCGCGVVREGVVGEGVVGAAGVVRISGLESVAGVAGDERQGVAGALKGVEDVSQALCAGDRLEASDVGLGPVAMGGVGALALAQLVSVRPQREPDVIGKAERASRDEKLVGEGRVDVSRVGGHVGVHVIVLSPTTDSIRCQTVIKPSMGGSFVRRPAGRSTGHAAHAI